MVSESVSSTTIWDSAAELTAKQLDEVINGRAFLAIHSFNVQHTLKVRKAGKQHPRIQLNLEQFIDGENYNTCSSTKTTMVPKIDRILGFEV